MRVPGASRNQIGVLRNNSRVEQLARARRAVHSQHTERVPFRSARARRGSVARRGHALPSDNPEES